ncbi:DgyrCDS13795 [Dimorphilus gyrociliatus]|uniref:Probable RNA-binding protein EIF1AD n=1 Tax=Dimorphilus gyrociliatus TaxID=2664684 RepID=A0A7I8WBR4_9ANNE|nr:DgyrCDS13795 [Dimorphilus gyrociliatus]
MSKATKRKHVVREVTEDFVLPEGDQMIVKVCASRGNNLHEVENDQGVNFLVSMPTKFRKNVWIKRGDYIVVKPIAEGDKVKAEIIQILYKDQIKYIKENGLWPSKFGTASKSEDTQQIPDDMLPPSDSEDETDEPVKNINHPNRQSNLNDSSCESEG